MAEKNDFNPGISSEAGLPEAKKTGRRPWAAAAGGSAGAAAGGPPGVGLEAFFSEQQLAARKHAERYKSAATEKEQRRLWRTWMLEARQEASSGRPGEWLVTCRQLAELPQSLVGEGVVKSPDLWLEQQLIWKVFEMKGKSTVAGGPVGEGGMAAIVGDMDGTIWNYLFGNEKSVAAGRPFLSVEKNQAVLGNVTAAEAIEKLDAAVAVDTRPYLQKGGQWVPNEKFGVTIKTWAKTTADGLAAFRAAYPTADPVDLEYVFRAGEDAYILANEQAKYSFKEGSWAWLAKAIRPDLEILGTAGGSTYIKEQVVRGAIPMLLSGYLSENTGRSPTRVKLAASQVVTKPFYRLKAVDATARGRAIKGKDLRGRDFESYEEYSSSAGFVKNPERVSLLSTFYAREVSNVQVLVAKVKDEALVEVFTKDPLQALTIMRDQGAGFLSKTSDATKSWLFRRLMSISIEFDRKPDRYKTVLNYPKPGESIARNEARLTHKPTDSLARLTVADETVIERRIRNFAELFTEEDYVGLLKDYCSGMWANKGRRILTAGLKSVGHAALGAVTGGLSTKR